MSAIDVYLAPISTRPWTTADEDFLREHYALMTADELAARLGRTRSAIYNRLNRLGIDRMTAQRARAGRDHRGVRRLRILLAYRMGILNEAEAAVAAGIPPGRLIVECAREAYLGQVEAGPGPERG